MSQDTLRAKLENNVLEVHFVNKESKVRVIITNKVHNKSYSFSVSQQEANTLIPAMRNIMEQNPGAIPGIIPTDKKDGE